MLKKQAKNALDDNMKTEYPASHVQPDAEIIHLQPDPTFMNLCSELNVSEERSSENARLLDLVDDPFFLGKASVLDRGLVVKLESLEILLRERRAQLEQFLNSQNVPVQ